MTHSWRCSFLLSLIRIVLSRRRAALAYASQALLEAALPRVGCSDSAAMPLLADACNTTLYLCTASLWRSSSLQIWVAECSAGALAHAKHELPKALRC